MDAQEEEWELTSQEVEEEELSAAKQGKAKKRAKRSISYALGDNLTKMVEKRNSELTDIRK